MSDHTLESVQAAAEAAWKDMIDQAPPGMQFPGPERTAFITGFSYGFVYARSDA